ncbi:MAG: hypothetical protein A3K22_00155 [Deltaproteobacteria bacterium RBG_16_42_7]|nr:MAG: hypothetical protein A3K22_00155 [Deltaproteobacteria bacterium RBG_16_42_7]
MKKTLSLLFLLLAMLFTASTFASEAKEIKGQFVSGDSRQSSVVVSVEVLGLAGPEKKATSFNLASDVKWTVCLSGQCAEKTGIEGFRLVNEYAVYEAYGLTPKDKNVTLIQSGDVITGVKINL